MWSRNWRKESRRASTIKAMPHTTPEVLRNVIQIVKTWKSSGYDNRVLKRFTRMVMRALKYIVNIMLRTNYFPNRWNHADVITLLNSEKDRTFPQNYRPISHIPSMSKVVEHVLLSSSKSTQGNLASCRTNTLGTGLYILSGVRLLNKFNQMRYPISILNMINSYPKHRSIYESE